MLRLKYRIYIILFIFIPVFSTGASANNKAVDVSSVIQINDNLLTVKAGDIPLRKVLMEIANQTPIKIVLYASAEEPFITNFSRLPMEKGLKKLLRDYDYAFTYGGEKSKGDGEHEIRKVIILSNGGKSRHRRAEPMITYTEEPSLEPLSDEPYDEDADIQETEITYTDDTDFQKSEDMYDEDLNYQESEDAYAEDLDFQESEDMYDEDPDLPEEHMLDPLEESEPMTASTGGGALEPLGEVPYDEDMDIREEEMEFDILRDELQDEEAGIRLGAVGILGAIGGDKAIQALEGSLTDEDEAVRELAAEELSRLQEDG